MSFRRDDFHNSRAYQADPPTRASGAILSATAWLKGWFDKLLRSGASSSMSAATLLDDKGPYSLLGSDGAARPSPNLDSTVFPMTGREPGFETSLQPAKVNGMRRHDRHAKR